MYDFHMALTRSSAKTENMVMSEEIRNYFSDIIKPLANKSILGGNVFKAQGRNSVQIWAEAWTTYESNWQTRRETGEASKSY